MRLVYKKKNQTKKIKQNKQNKCFLGFGLTCRLFMLSGVVHCLRAQQTTTLHSVWSDHWQRVCVPRLQWKPVWPEWRCLPKQELSCHCQNKYVHMYDQIYTGYICAPVQSIPGDVQCRVEPLMTSACHLALLHRLGGQTGSLQGKGHGLCAQVYSTPGGQICRGWLQHRHQLCCQRLSQGEHA